MFTNYCEEQMTGSPCGCFTPHQTAPPRKQRGLRQKLRRSHHVSRQQQRGHCLVRTQAVASLERVEAVTYSAQDKWLQKLLKLLPQDPNLISEHQRECIEALATQKMPTIRNEEYRFTDVSLLLKTEPQKAQGQVTEDQVNQFRLQKEDDAVRLVIVDGQISDDLSHIGPLPGGAFVGRLQDAPQSAAAKLGEQSRLRGGPFAIVNGALCEDILCINLDTAVEMERPVHILYISTGRSEESKLGVSHPRVLVNLAERASMQIVEEFVSTASADQFFSNSVTEVALEKDSHLKHKYVELDSAGAWQLKSSIVSQAEGSKYHLTETQLGGKLTRHDLSILQTGPETETIMKAFLLCGPSQLHDLHSKLKLEHPRGQASQLHKCIVSASSGRGVFDGNVKVERYAQQTDAAQLSRNLLLAPKATVNVKPNLQIIADDVKCSHGCAVSDLEAEQLLYFRTRGIDYATARQVLVYSFGSEVTNDFKFDQLTQRIQERINATLAKTTLS